MKSLRWGVACLLVTIVACGDDDRPPGDGGASDGAMDAPVTDGGRDGGEPDAAECAVAADCPAPASECVIAECTDGTCVVVPVAAGEPVSSQTPGDCQVLQCDGEGALEEAHDDTDLPDDGNDCTTDTCVEGTPTHTPIASGTACGTGDEMVCDGDGACVGCLTAASCSGTDGECGARSCVDMVCGMSFAAVGTACTTGGTMCDGSGACVECVTADDCSGTDDECQVRTCTAGVCGVAFTAAGTPLSAQTAGDCERRECDGAGAEEGTVDDTDVPDDGNECTVGVCSSGVPSHAPVAPFTACTGGVCDGEGVCDTSTDTGAFHVLRVGTGAAALSNESTALFLDGHAADGALLGSIALPTAVVGMNAPITSSGTATSEGGLARSTNGAYLVLAGYGAPPGVASIASSSASLVSRVVARVDAAGDVDSSTLLDAFSGNNVRAATSIDGTSFWVGGAGTGGGIQYVTLGSSGGSTLVLGTPGNVRVAHIYDGQLYGSSGSSGFSAVFSVGAGVPTTTGQTATVLPGMPTGSSPYSFVLFDLDSAVAGPDTLYVADDRAIASGGGVQRWTFDGTTWTLSATFGTSGFRGLTGTALGGVVLILATAPGRVVRFLDDGTATPTETVLTTAPTNTAYRGVALPPR